MKRENGNLHMSLCWQGDVTKVKPLNALNELCFLNGIINILDLKNQCLDTVDFWSEAF